MDQRVKKLWIDALRSEEYQQGKSMLRDKNNRFCCLGVLCDIAVKEGVVEWGWTVQGHAGGIPRSVVGWSGLPSTTPLIGERLAAEWNDSLGRTFPEIADLIEEHL